MGTSLTAQIMADGSARPSETEKPVEEKTEDNAPKEEVSWDSHTQFLLACLAFGVGLGNVWRFPYLVQKYGGGSFIIPFLVMMFIEAMPLLLIELGLGQKFRSGSVGIWKKLHPYFQGIGYACMIESVVIGFYYNVIIAWSFFYLFNSFFNPLPWSVCPIESVDYNDHNTLFEGIPQPVAECANSDASTFFFYRTALNTSDTISDDNAQDIHIPMMIIILFAWFFLYLMIFKGIQSSGKAMYVTATFPYVTLTIFLIYGLTLDGALDGLAYLFTPDYDVLATAQVWLDAGTQVFFSMSLAVGGIIAFSSYNDRHSPVVSDTIFISTMNGGTAIYTALVIFSILGFKAKATYQECVSGHVDIWHDIRDLPSGTYPDNVDHEFGPNDYDDFTTYYNTYREEFNKEIVFGDSSTQYWCDKAQSVFNQRVYPDMPDSLDTEEKFEEWLFTQKSCFEECSLAYNLDNGVQGTGLAFIAVADAITVMPGGPFWAVLFFLMLLTLGLGSAFGTLEGFITPVFNILGDKLPKPALTGIMSLSLAGLGMIFAQRSGTYWVDVFNDYGANTPLLVIGFFEFAVIGWLYGVRRFMADIDSMIGGPTTWYGKAARWYFKICLWFIAPILLLGIFILAMVGGFDMSYKAWNESGARYTVPNPEYDDWVQGIIWALQIVPCVPIIAVPIYLWIQDKRHGTVSKGLVFDGWKMGDSPVWDPVNKVLIPPINSSLE